MSLDRSQFQPFHLSRRNEKMKSRRVSGSRTLGTSVPLLSCGHVAAVVSQITVPSQRYTGYVFSTSSWFSQIDQSVWGIIWSVWWFGGFWRDHRFDAGYASRFLHPRTWKWESLTISASLWLHCMCFVHMLPVVFRSRCSLNCWQPATENQCFPWEMVFRRWSAIQTKKAMSNMETGS